MRTVGLEWDTCAGNLGIIYQIKLKSRLTPSGDMKNNSQFMNHR